MASSSVVVAGASTAYLPLDDYAKGLPDGSEFTVEDLEQGGATRTYVVWKGEAYAKRDEAPRTVIDFHDASDYAQADFQDANQLFVYNDEVWTRTWTEEAGYC